jgi:alpha,alpha-trehalase
MSNPEIQVTPERFDAVLFDLDGVLTATAKIHATCWKRIFDGFLERRAAAAGSEVVPFDTEADYLPYVDGKPRYDGVKSFLASRGIELPWGDPADPPGDATVCGIGNTKAALFNQVLREQVPEVYQGSVDYVRHLHDHGIKTAIVSASKNAGSVLKAAGIDDLFDLRVDGLVAAELELAGKPAPDIFLEAARELGVEPARAVVVEDAISGVQAGRAGNFGLVIGVDRTGSAEQLRANGADVVVADLGDLLS